MANGKAAPNYEIFSTPPNGPHHVVVSVGVAPVWFRRIATFTSLDRAESYAAVENDMSDDETFRADDTREPPPGYAEPESRIDSALRGRKDELTIELSFDASEAERTLADLQERANRVLVTAGIADAALSPGVQNAPQADTPRAAEPATELPPIAETSAKVQLDAVPVVKCAPLSPAESQDRLMAWILAYVIERYPVEGPMSLSRIREQVLNERITLPGVDVRLPAIREAVEALANSGKVAYRTVHRDKPMMVSLPGPPERVDGVGPAESATIVSATAKEAAKIIVPVAEVPTQPNPKPEPIRQSEPVTPTAEPDWDALCGKIIAWLPDAIEDDPKGPTIMDAASHFFVDSIVARDAFRIIAKAGLAEIERRADSGAYHMTPKGYTRPREDLSPLQEEVLGAVVSHLMPDGICRMIPAAIAMDVGKPQGSIHNALEALRKKGYLEGCVDKNNYWHKPIQQKAA